MPFHYSYGQWLPCQGLNQNENSDDSYIWSIPIMVIVHWLISITPEILRKLVEGLR